MNSGRNLWILTGVAIVCGVLLFFGRQHQHLSALRSEIEAKRAGLAASWKDTSGPREGGRSRNRSGDANRPGLTDDGEADLPEARELLKKMSELLKGKTRQEYAAMEGSPELDRLRWLLAGMGGKTFLKLMEGREPLWLANAPYEDVFQKMFEEMNPQQALEILMSYPPDHRSDLGIADDFLHWSQLAPEAALRWFHEKEAEGDSVAQWEKLQFQVMKAEVAIHPASVVSRMLQMDFSDGMQVKLNVICGNMREPGERIAFLTALDAAQTDGIHEREAGMLREMFLKSIRTDLSEQPFAEASKVLDAAYSPAEKVNFANSLSGDLDSRTSSEEWTRWSRWMAGLDAPVDQNHPLVKLMLNRSNTGGSQPTWIENVPAGPLRDLAVSKYVGSFASPEAAVKLLGLLPEGQERRDLARTVQSRAKNASPEAVKSLQEFEGSP